MPPTMLPEVEFCAMTLADYAKIIGYDECAFFGVYYDGQIDYACNMFWTEWQRMDIYRALVEAQELIENVVGYPLCKTWITGEPTEFSDQRFIDKQPFSPQMITRWGHFISNGVRVEEVLDESAAVNHGTDPAVVGPLTVTINDISEVKVFRAGTRYEVTPSRMTYSGGNLTIYIPRCRLLAVPNTVEQGANYDYLSNFLTAVDVVRVYNDPSVAATLVDHHACCAACAGNGCGEHTHTGCIYPIDRRLGIVEVQPATYASNAWTTTGRACYRTDEVRLNYCAGLTSLSIAWQNVLVRLAHARMAAMPCGCDHAQKLWERDRTTPDILSRERLNCPFGPSEGAWVAYKFAQSQKRLGMQVW